MTQGQVFSFLCPTQIYMGVESYKETGNIIKKLRLHRCLFLADAALLKSPIFNFIQEILAGGKVAFSVFSEIEPDPDANTVEKAFAVGKEQNAAFIIALGGGSTLDVGKAVGILMTNGGRIHDYEGVEKYSKPRLPLIALPTTAGTGSEVSGSCVITDIERNFKMSVRHARLNPADYAILDPLALTTLPASVAAHSGLDAFVHGLESFVSRGANLLTDALNIEAISLISNNIRKFVADRENLEAGLAMLCGSALAGIAFGQTGLGNVHCMARFIGARFHLSHGLSNAVSLPMASAFNINARPKKYALVARAMGKDTRNMSDIEAARLALDAFKELCADLEIPDRLRDVGVTEESLEEMAELCAGAGYNRWNPRHTTYADFLKMFRNAY
jgi:alcohol dehydrogenase